MAPFAAGEAGVVRKGGTRATVDVHEADGTLWRVFELTLLKDGWWPDGYRECVD